MMKGHLEGMATISPSFYPTCIKCQSKLKQIWKLCSCSSADEAEGREKGRETWREGKKRGKEKVKRCRIMRVSVWECSFIEHKYKRDRCEYIFFFFFFFFYNRVFTTQSHIETPLWTHKSFEHKKKQTLEYKLVFRVVCGSCSDF